ncbi:MAG: DUF2157 domain-containing protein [Oscillospiraceae bacterium]
MIWCLAILWVISPLVFIPVTIVLASKNKKLKKDIDMLTKGMNSEYRYSNNFETDNAEKKEADNTTASSVQHVPVATNAPPPVPAKSINPMNIILVTGVILVVLAGIIFSTTNWSIMGKGLKTLIVILAAVLFYVVGIIAEKKFRLEKLGKAFFSLGSIFLPISVIAIGYFQFFGGLFSFNGYSGNLVIMAAFLVLAVTCFISSAKYKSELFAMTSLSGISGAVICMILILFDNHGTGFSLVPIMFAVYSLAVMFAMPKIKYAECFSAYEKVMEKFIIMNTALFSIVTVVHSFSNGENSSVPLVIFGIMFLNNSFNKKYKIFGIFPFAIYLLLGMTNMHIPSSCSEYIIISCAAAITSIVISETSMVSGAVAKALRCYSYIMMSVSLFSAFIDILNSEADISSVISLILIYAAALWLSLRHNSRPAKYIHPFLAFVSIFHLSMLIPLTPEQSYILFFILITICFVIYYKCIRLHSFFADTLFMVGIFISVCSNLSSLPKNICFIGGLCLTFMLTLVSFNGSTKKCSVASGYLIVPSLLFAFAIITNGFSTDNYNSFTIMRVLFIIIAASAIVIPMLNSSKDFYVFGKCLELWIYFIAFYNIPDVNFPYFLITSVFCAVRIRTSLDYKMDNQALFYTYTSAAYFIFEVLLFTYDKTAIDIYIPMLAIGFVMMAAQIVLMLKNRDNFFNTPLYTSAGILIILSIITAAFFIDNNYQIIGLMFICIVLYIYSYTYKGSSFYGFVSSAMLYFFMFMFAYENYLNDYYKLVPAMTASFCISVAAGNFINNRLYTKAVVKPVCKPWLVYLSAVFPLVIIWISLCGKEDLTKWTSVGWFLAAIYVAVYIRKNNQVIINRIHISCALIIFAQAVACQEWIDIPPYLRTEFYITLGILYCLALKKIWKGYEKRVNKITFAVAIISIVYLIYEIFIYRQLIDAEILISAGIVMMIFSFMKKRKKWFILSSATVIFIVFYMTRDFWFSIQWWLYLLMAGILLISVAGANEYLKTKGESIKSKTNEWFNDWY